jgi:hypothetical protein
LKNGAGFDESFTAMMGRQSVSDMFSALRTSDSHPPLDYLLRAPLARAGVGELALRAPSLLFSSAALVLFAWWMRNRGLAGIVALAVMAVSPFQIMYGGEARMYALLELLGVAAAVISEAWLRTPRRWHATAVGAIVLVAVFDHVSGLLLAAGLFAVAGVRRDGGAWRWRAWIGGAVLVWAATWGPSFLAQSSTTHASWIDRTSLTRFVDAVSSLVTNQQGVALLIVLVIAAGLLRLVLADRVLGRVVMACGLLPIVAAAVLGFAVPFFINRAVTVSAWVPCLAVGFIVEGASRRSMVLGVFVSVVVALLIVPATVVFLQRHWEYDEATNHLTAVARSGDVVATVPDWYGPLVDWTVGVQAHGGSRRVALPSVPLAHAIQVGNAQASGRVWMLTFAGDQRRFTGVPRCAPDWTDGVTDIACLALGRAG